MTTIKKNTKGKAVKILQTYFNLVVDGICGNKTIAAINNWKENYGMNPNSEFNESDWIVFAQTLPTIKINSTGKEVKMWQIFLGITIDGKFGSRTKSSTCTYQSITGLIVDGIVGKNTWLKAFGGKTQNNNNSNSNITINTQPIDYKQYDSRWGAIKYSTHTASQTIRNSGCGPTSMADIVATWWDYKITPKEMCALAVSNGFRTYNNGTDWEYFKFCAEKYGASKFIQTTSIATLKTALQDGAYAVVSFGQSKWTKGGHFCCIWKWDGKYFYVNDPASAASSRAKGTESEVLNARKQFFIFYK